MARKSFMYAVLEAVQFEMRQDPAMVWIFELTPPVSSNPGKPVINLEKEFGRNRVVNTGIDERVSAPLEVVREHGGCRVLTNLGGYQDSKHLHIHVSAGESLR